MQLTLTVLRCPPAVAPETRTLSGGEYTIGRGPGVDWVLSDVNQMVSRRHCTLVFRGGDWQIIDDSANGTFPNHDDAPIGKGNTRSLRDHDRLRIGPYEIEVHLAEDATAGPGGYAGRAQGGPYADDPFAEPLWPAAGGVPGFPAGSPATDGGRGRYGDGFVERTQDDHSSALDDAMWPPNPVEHSPMPLVGKIPADNLLPEGWETDLLADLSAITPAARPLPTRPAPPVAEPKPEPVAAAPDAAGMVSDAALLAAFLAGAGLPDAKPADPVATMRRLGETYRAMVSGLREVLIARASIKSEFRIEQTMIRPRNNNPLKFSANDDDAVAALFGVGRHVDMAPARAVTDVLRDIRLHELASMAAMQSAVRALLQGVGPDRVRASLEPGGLSMLPNQKKARAWDAYEALHGRIAQALSDDFDSVFGKAFARAYEEALDELAHQDRS